MTNTADTVDLAHRLAPGATDAPAVSAPDRPTLTHGGLRRLIRETVAKMNELGLGRGDRVAIVLPNGPEMATAFLAVAAAASTAPLNPAYRADELDFYLS
ncbi:MAG: AMP-dependent synthetase, partial [Mesorhizobium sp.]